MDAKFEELLRRTDGAEPPLWLTLPDRVGWGGRIPGSKYAILFAKNEDGSPLIIGGEIVVASFHWEEAKDKETAALLQRRVESTAYDLLRWVAEKLEAK